MTIVANKERLLKNAGSTSCREARILILDAIQKALDAVDPKNMVRSNLSVKDHFLVVGDKKFDLEKYDSVIVVGGGKASGSMAEAVEKILGEHINKGLVVVPRRTAVRYKTTHIRLHESSHPIPDHNSVDGAKKIIQMVEKSDERDLVICLISGGGSSLMALPTGDVDLASKQRITQMLLKSGATINEINTVRKHISDFKGGQIAKRAYPATVLSLLLSDVVGDPLDVIASGPTVPDTTTFSDAVYILKKYGLWDITPGSIQRILSEGIEGQIPETPKESDPCFKKVHNIVIGNNRTACMAAVDHLRKKNLNTLFFSSSVEGEARDLGTFLGAIGMETSISGNPMAAPFGAVIGGETTVTVKGHGKGGRNQEIALSAAHKIADLKTVVIASFSTDGIDGPTDAAGAIVDGNTLSRAKKLNMDARDYMKNNDSYTFFSKLGDNILTGPTGTNVNDISVLVALA